jgi:hypothetical protein
VPVADRAGHGPIEQCTHVRVARQIVVERHAEEALTGRLASSHGLEHFGPQGIVHLTVQQQARLQRSRMIAPEVFSHGCQAEPVIGDLCTDPQADQATQNALRRRVVHAERARQFRRGMVAMPQLVGEAELRGDVQHLGGLSAVRRLEQGALGLWHRCVRTPWLCHPFTPVKTWVVVLSAPIGRTMAYQADVLIP